MKIALLGYGKMGKAIDNYCQRETNHQIGLKIHSGNAYELTTDNLQKVDIAIDFSTPELATKHIRACFDANLPVVCGTTGWLHDFAAIKQECIENNKSFFYASNFSVGVNLFWKLVAYAGDLLSDEDFQLQIDETHHTEKQDAPSGTAITTAEELIKVMKKYTKWTLGNSETDNEIPIFAHREEDVPGTHLVTFHNKTEQIKIEHIAKSRIGFVSGAVLAAEFLQNKKGVFTMQHLLASMK